MSYGPKRHSLLLTTLCWGALAGSLFQVGQAQETRIRDRQSKAKHEDVTLETKDGVFLHATYYPGQDSKSTVPFILLHEWKGSRNDLHATALFLQKEKCAVIVPDLRGHGRSTSRRGLESGDRIDPDRMNKSAIAMMVWDVEACKQFLLKKNNEGLLNIEQLCVMGAEMGATMAANWAVEDWNTRDLPAYKMGRDVKALILVSPQRSFKGLTTQAATSHPIIRKELSIMIVVGERDAGAVSDARRLHRSLDRFHTNPDEQDLVLLTPDTSLQGTKLLNANIVSRQIAFFIKDRLVNKSTRFKWTNRTGPFDQ